jgi:hypothetical protein
MKAFARNKDVVQVLREQVPQPEAPARERFWADFRARASLVPQQSAGGLTVGRSRWRSPVYAVLSAAAAVVVAVAVFRGSGSSAVQPSAKLSKVSELDVYMDYSSVMIVEDQQNRGTVIWMASADLSNGG